ncbi:TetR/AcrR family transcriptional regulator [Rubellimicrobium arenae]|uniref:TetR/AcrR family transcriptional regulator n=1 Tax=Rubellimicrobium arenae TaxID=2817372 RepID=UPI001B30CF72|nr:TetR/AcrR family transcriptional regulator [Rubellimicrobium arenae]
MTMPDEPSNGPPAHRRMRGRPVDPSKREAVLAAARDQFLHRGYEGLSIEGVAATAGVAKGTIYKSFPDKESLFEAVIAREVRAITDPDGGGAITDCSFRDRLIAFGLRLVARSTDPALNASTALFRMESMRRPELAHKVYELGAARVLDELARLIAEGAAEGAIAPDDLRLAAEDLTGLWHRAEVERLRHGIVERIDPEDLRSRVVRGVDLFLRAHAPRSTDLNLRD